MRQKIANMVHEVWLANKDNPDPIMDRGQALKMLISNFEAKKREGGKMLYLNGNIPEVDFKEAQDYWCALANEIVESMEYQAILKIVNKLKW